MGRLRPEFLVNNGFDRAEVLIETGSQTGLGAERCAHLFSEIHTIEISRRLFYRARKKLKRFLHVHVHKGDSPKVLKRLLTETQITKKATTLWLDAHFVAGYSPCLSGVPQCPLMAELQVIFSFAWETPPVILIDDAPMFTRRFWERSAKAAGYDRSQWPRVQEITRMARRYGYGAGRLNDVLVVEKLEVKGKGKK